MRQFECKCMECGSKRQYAFKVEPYPNIGDIFIYFCGICQADTNHTRVLTRKMIAELNRKHQEEELRESISKKCAEYGFQHRFLYQSVIVTTNLSDWCFDYHESRITLYHESTVKINVKTGNYAKAHIQFEKRKMKPLEVIEYIASHDAWKTEQNRQPRDNM